MKLNDLKPNSGPRKNANALDVVFLLVRERRLVVAPKARALELELAGVFTGKVAICHSSAVCLSYVVKALPRLTKLISMK